MAKAFSLQPLLELMQTRSDEATRRLGQLIAAENDAKSRLGMLEQYRAEYATRLNQAITTGLTPLVLRNYQDFLGRIDEAIGQQRLMVQQSASNTAAGKQHWQDQNKRLKAIDTLSVRHDKREQIVEGKREQKILDEYTTRRFASPRNEDND